MLTRSTAAMEADSPEAAQTAVDDMAAYLDCYADAPLLNTG